MRDLIVVVSLLFIATFVLTFLRRPWSRSVLEPFKAVPDAMADIEYMGCAAYKHANPGDPNDTSTVDVLTRDPMYSMYVVGRTRQELLDVVVSNLKKVAGANDSRVVGPVYMLIGRNRDNNNVEGRVYLPSVGKDMREIRAQDEVLANHAWLRDVLFSNIYTTSDWLCNNLCDTNTIPPKKKILSGYSYEAIDDVSRPECGCVSRGACAFYNVPSGFSAAPHNIKGIVTYSIYRLKPGFFETTGIEFSGQGYIDMSSLLNGSKVYEGCTRRLLSKNRQHAFEITPNGYAYYNAEDGKLFGDSCATRPENDSRYKSIYDLWTKINNAPPQARPANRRAGANGYAYAYDYSLARSSNKERDMEIFKQGEVYDEKNKELQYIGIINGTQPYLTNEDKDISIHSIVPNPSSGTPEMVRQWNIKTGKNDPFVLFLDDTGVLKVRDKKGAVQSAEFVQKSQAAQVQ